MSFNLDLLIGGINRVIRQQDIDRNNEICEYFVEQEIEAAKREAEIEAYREIPPGFFDDAPYISKRDKALIRNADKTTLKQLGVVKEYSIRLQDKVEKDKAHNDENAFNFNFDMEDLS